MVTYGRASLLRLSWCQNTHTALCPRLIGWAGTWRKIHPLTFILFTRYPLWTSSSYYDPWHPLCSIYVLDSPFPQPLSRSSLVFLLVWDGKIHVCRTESRQLRVCMFTLQDCRTWARSTRSRCSSCISVRCADHSSVRTVTTTTLRRLERWRHPAGCCVCCAAGSFCGWWMQSQWLRRPLRGCLAGDGLADTSWRPCNAFLYPAAHSLGRGGLMFAGCPCVCACVCNSTEAFSSDF